MEFIKELKRLGLKDKEAAVYLSCLELGPATAQQVSRKAKVVRATTYVELESLMQMGLVTKFKQGKKTLFSAEPPRQLMRLLEKRREQLAEKQHELEHLLPELQVIMKASEGRPTVRYFEGIEGLRSIRREMIMYGGSQDIWYNFTPVDSLFAIFGSGDELLYTKQRVAKGIRVKTLFTTRSKQLKAETLKTAPSDLSERRFVSPEKFPISSGMTIYRDRIALGSFTGRVGGVVIESQNMADMMKGFFELAWQSAEVAVNVP